MIRHVLQHNPTISVRIALDDEPCCDVLGGSNHHCVYEINCGGVRYEWIVGTNAISICTSDRSIDTMHLFDNEPILSSFDRGDTQQMFGDLITLGDGFFERMGYKRKDYSNEHTP